MQPQPSCRAAGWRMAVIMGRICGECTHRIYVLRHKIIRHLKMLTGAIGLFS
jgi:hypothetical protein